MDVYTRCAVCVEADMAGHVMCARKRMSLCKPHGSEYRSMGMSCDHASKHRFANRREFSGYRWACHVFKEANVALQTTWKRMTLNGHVMCSCKRTSLCKSMQANIAWQLIYGSEYNIMDAWKLCITNHVPAQLHACMHACKIDVGLFAASRGQHNVACQYTQLSLRHANALWKFTMDASVRLYLRNKDCWYQTIAKQ